MERQTGLLNSHVDTGVGYSLGVSLGLWKHINVKMYKPEVSLE